MHWKIEEKKKVLWDWQQFCKSEVLMLYDYICVQICVMYFELEIRITA